MTTVQQIPVMPQATVNTTPVVARSQPITETAPECETYTVPAPVILISVLGAIIVIYTAIAPGVDQNRRVFGIVLMILWTLIWALLLWVLWRECHRAAAWWLLLLAVTAMILFFVLIIIQNVGSSI
jgi:hypothetical protein